MVILLGNIAEIVVLLRRSLVVPAIGGLSGGESWIFASRLGGRRRRHRVLSALRVVDQMLSQLKFLRFAVDERLEVVRQTWSVIVTGPGHLSSPSFAVRSPLMHQPRPTGTPHGEVVVDIVDKITGNQPRRCE